MISGWAARKKKSAGPPLVTGVVVSRRAARDFHDIMATHSKADIWRQDVIAHLTALELANRRDMVMAASKRPLRLHTSSRGHRGGVTQVGYKIRYPAATGGQLRLHVAPLAGGGWAVFHCWLKKSLTGVADPAIEITRTMRARETVRKSRPTEPDKTFTLAELTAKRGWMSGTEWADELRGVALVPAPKPRMGLVRRKAPRPTSAVPVPTAPVSTKDGEMPVPANGPAKVCQAAQKALGKKYPKITFDPTETMQVVTKTLRETKWGARGYVKEIVEFVVEAVEDREQDRILKALVTRDTSYRLAQVGLSMAAIQNLPASVWRKPWQQTLLDRRPDLTIKQLTAIMFESGRIPNEGRAYRNARANVQRWRHTNDYGPLPRGNPTYSKDYPKYGWPANWKPAPAAESGIFKPTAGHWPRRRKNEHIQLWASRVLHVDSSLNVDQIAALLTAVGAVDPETLNWTDWPNALDWQKLQALARALIVLWRAERGLDKYRLPDEARADWLPEGANREKLPGRR